MNMRSGITLAAIIGLGYAAHAGANAVSADSGPANPTQVGLPGYLPDAEALQDTPQKVFDALLSDPTAKVVLDKQERGVMVVEFDDRARETYVFFGRGHWAYPSVVRYRRAKQDGFWATRTAFRCGANAYHCRRLEAEIESRQPQVALMDAETMALDAVAHIRRPLPTGMVFGGPDYWLVNFGWTPGSDEYAWKHDFMRSSQVNDRDAHGAAPVGEANNFTCKIVPAKGPVYGSRPNYPMTEDATGIGGTAILLVLINGEGKVIDGVVESSSHDRSLDREAMNAVAIYRFNMEGCSAADSVVARQPVEFVPGNYLFSGPLASVDAVALGFDHQAH